MSGPVDVLAVLDEFALYVRNVSSRHALQGDILETRAAVAKLIEAAEEFSGLYGCLWDVVAPDGAGFLSPESVKKYDEAHGKLMAALARVRGAK